MSTRNISLRQLRYFIAVAECGKVSEAARRVSISQSAITTAIQDLEVEVGTKLLERGPRGMSLTFQGHQFLQRAHAILNDVEDAVSSLQFDTRRISGSLRLGVTDAVAAYYMPAVVTTFRRAWPQVDIQVSERSREALESDLRMGALDLGLAILTNTTPHEDVASETITRLPRHVWVNADHPLLNRSHVEPADLVTEPYVMLTRDQVEHVTLNRFRSLGLEPRIAYRVSSVEAVRSLVANGAGITVLSDLLYRPWSLEGRRVERVDVPELFPGAMEIGLLWLRTQPLSQVTTAFRDLLRGIVGARQDRSSLRDAPTRTPDAG